MCRLCVAFQRKIGFEAVYATGALCGVTGHYSPCMSNVSLEMCNVSPAISLTINNKNTIIVFKLICQAREDTVNRITDYYLYPIGKQSTNVITEDA